MHHLIRLIGILLLGWGAASAQSSLPACPATGYFHNCFGTFTFPGGNKYVGEFKDSKRDGQGTFTFANGDKYVGGFKDDKRNGQGTSTWANGDKYDGEYKDGKRDGLGTLTFGSGSQFSGDKYVGEYKDDERDGQGTYTFANGDKYVGEYKDGKRNGQGTFTWPSGSKYVGKSKDNKFNGQGTYTWADGSKYVGEHKDGKRDGQATLFRADGSVASAGIWANDKFVRAAPVQQQPSNTPNPELARLRAEAEEAKRRQAQAEEQLRLAQQAAVPPAPQAAQSRGINAHALVIGNAAYAGGNRLLNPLNDARAVSQLLRRLGFTVTQVEDANRAKLVSSLVQFSRSAMNADLSLLFYSGHGIQIEATNYLVPIDDVDTDFAPLQGVSINTVLERYMPGKAKLVFLDACRTNPMMASATKGFSKGLASINVSEGTLISYAAKDGQTAADGVAGGNSPFTAALLEHLADPEDIAVVLRKVREKVMRNTGGRQQPWEYGSLTGGALVLSALKPQ